MVPIESDVQLVGFSSDTTNALAYNRQPQPQDRLRTIRARGALPGTSHLFRRLSHAEAL
ncbi:hypothetical protein M404DRAFT_1009141 [Pisolithus tinctorius Marx 270]|uniref:Uncharacterized protein n=1 Tax=Pisolithus tinctorius Marx 270 TaxID=870435 RepID=A0A0C3NB98_PISTI|nr:hypothetical protein M404DRAFT_1009141 [Pisolithus tinctorius Marx 270]